jgi:hypothetical protein
MAVSGTSGFQNFTPAEGLSRRAFLALPAQSAFAAFASKAADPPLYNVKKFGALADGNHLDTKAINQTIKAAAQAGGGIVCFPEGFYLSYTIQLASNVWLYLDSKAIIKAAPSPTTPTETGGYRPAEAARPWQRYQDFGHNHWRDSLIWGDGVENVVVFGKGLIWGAGLVNGSREPGKPPAAQPGVGEKAIALHSCANVTLLDFSILDGGHFGVLATGVKNLTIDGLKIDTNRDGINVDCGRYIRIAGCHISSRNDDGICIKSSDALGERIPAADVDVENCVLYGDLAPGALVDGSFRKRPPEFLFNVTHHTGRIKLGTESYGGFKRIRISGCRLYGCRGLALITTDGGPLEDIRVSNIGGDIYNAPVFVFVGARDSGPPGIRPGRADNIRIHDIELCQNTTAWPMIVAGLSDDRVGNVTLSNVTCRIAGGGKIQRTNPPEARRAYPDPECFGPNLPASGLFARHIGNLVLRDFRLISELPDLRPALWLDDIGSADIAVREVCGIVSNPVVRQERVTSLKLSGIAPYGAQFPDTRCARHDNPPSLE